MTRAVLPWVLVVRWVSADPASGSQPESPEVPDGFHIVAAYVAGAAR
jgi:hypothetical protein